MAIERKVTKRKDGRIQRRITVGRTVDGKPIRISVYGKTVAEANTKKKELLEKYIRGELSTNPNITVAEYAERWLESSVPQSRHKSYAAYDGLIKNHTIPAIGNKAVKDVSVTDINAILTGLVNDKKLRTAEYLRVMLIQIFELAFTERIVPFNTAKYSKPVGYKAKRKKVLSEKDIDVLLSSDLSAQERLFVCLCLFQGLRKEEALALKKTNKDVIEIHETWYSVGNRGYIKDGTKSPAGQRTLAIMPQTAAAIIDIAGTLSKTDRRYFKGVNGRDMSAQQYKLMWARIMKAYTNNGGDNSFTAHVLRHTFCTMLYYAGFDLLQMQYLMGHDDIQTTAGTYTHIQKESLGKKDKYLKWQHELRLCFLGHE